MRSKISVKTRDCEHKMIGGFFERKCFCRKMLCNLGYDDRYQSLVNLRFNAYYGVETYCLIDKIS